MTERTLKDIRNAVTEKTVDILAGYRKNVSTSHPPGQLVLPENLKEFVMYMLSVIKSRAFKGISCVFQSGCMLTFFQLGPNPLIAAHTQCA